MKILKTILLTVFTLCITTACHHDVNEEEKTLAKRTVLIYMCAENNLDQYSFFEDNYRDMITGAQYLTDDQNLIIFADRMSKEEKPYIAKCDKNGIKKVKVYSEDFYCTDKEKMKEVMQWVAKNYPAESYGLSFWGHANGWIQMSDAFTRSTSKLKQIAKAYGYDTGEDHPNGSDGYKFINIQDLDEAIATSFPKLDFIFFDCCQAICAEVAYEMRNTARYLIGSPAEIPGKGAPYVKVVTDFFLAKDEVGPAIVDDYIGSLTGKGIDTVRVKGLPLSVIDTDRMNDFAEATATALSTFMSKYQYPNELDLSGMIYYGKNDYVGNCPCFYDARNIMRVHLSSEDFKKWDEVLQKTVVYSSYPGDDKQKKLTNWATQEQIAFTTFQMNEANYGGISLFVPQNYYQWVSGTKLNPNKSIFRMSWTNVVDWSKWGWSRE